ncbi:MAG: S6e family ribosomal protein [Candidatus Pacearchaeota archaeon]
MPFKINIAEKTGKTYKLELESEDLIGKELHSKIPGETVLSDLEGYEFEIAGASDKAGFTSHKDVPGIGLKKLLLSYEKGMKTKPKREGKKKFSNSNPKGLRLRKTVRGKVISPEITQINLNTIKEGKKKLSEIFPDQNKSKEAEAPSETPKTEEAPKEKVEQKNNSEEKK